MTTLAEIPSRAKGLKAGTTTAHDRLDQRIMAAAPFADRARYSRFLAVQHAFHRDIDALYDSQDLAGLLPDLPGRRRLPLIVEDLRDLGIEASAGEGIPHFSGAFDMPEALGWLYVAEGSNLGAAFLLKEAAKLGLDENFGARHLAPAPEGRGLSWRTFTAALDAAPLSASDEQKTIVAATAAFTRVQALVESFMPMDVETSEPAA